MSTLPRASTQREGMSAIATLGSLEMAPSAWVMAGSYTILTYVVPGWLFIKGSAAIKTVFCFPVVQCAVHTYIDTKLSSGFAVYS